MNQDIPIDFLQKFLEEESIDLEPESELADLRRKAIVKTRLMQANMLSKAGLRYRFADFHSHWDGILPVDHLIDLWKEKGEVYEALKSSDQRKRSPPRTEELMFLSLSAAILDYKGKKKKDDSVPDRGAHLLQFVIIYVWWWAFLTGVRNYTDEKHEFSVNYGGDDGLWKKTRDLLDELYKRKPSSNECDDGKKIGRIFARKALHKYLRATKTAPFDDAYVARSALMKLFPKDRRAWDDRTIGYLVEEEQIVNLQVSQSTDKIRPPADAVDNYDEEPKPYVRWLALLASHHSACKKGGKGNEDDTFNKFRKDTDDALKKIETDNRVIGIDWAGPEGFEFDQEPTNKAVEYTLNELHKISDKKKRTLLFRPHVGEGSMLLEGGKSLIKTEPKTLMELILRTFKSTYDAFKNGNADDAPQKDLARRLAGHRIARKILKPHDYSFKVLAGQAYTEAKRLACKNVDTLLNAIDEFKKKNPNIKGDVKIRFGHATHATRKQGKRMKELQVAADINLGSNLRTGAFAFMNDLDEADTVKETEGKWNWNAKALGAHSLKSLLLEDVSVVFGSDGQGVEATKIGVEYYMVCELVTPKPCCTLLRAGNREQWVN